MGDPHLPGFGKLQSALQAKESGFSAYAYELLPLMHTLMGHNKIETDLLNTDMLAFLSGFKGHITPVMQDFAANAKRGDVGREAASQKNHANSLVKVCPTHWSMHTTNVSDGRCPHVLGSNPVPYHLHMRRLLLSRGSCIPVASNCMHDASATQQGLKRPWRFPHLCMIHLLFGRGSCIPVALCGRYTRTLHAFQVSRERRLTIAQPCAMCLSLCLVAQDAGLQQLKWRVTPPAQLPEYDADVLC